MPDITKIKVDGEPESSYQLYPRNNEFVERANVQPDWNQNDVSAPDYVKNRTHWTEPEILDVIFQQDDVALYDATDFLESNQLLVLSEELVVGGTYNVNIDGVDHYVVCYTTNNSDVHYLGKEQPDRFRLYGSGSSVKLYLYEFSYGSTIRLTITHITPSKIHKIDPKYIPDVDLELIVPDVSITKEYTNDDIKIKSGSIESVMQKVNNGETVNIVVKTVSRVGTNYARQELHDVEDVSTYGESIYIYYRNREVLRAPDGSNLRVYRHTLQLGLDGLLMYHELMTYAIAYTVL